MDELVGESRGKDPRMMRSKKNAAVSTDGDGPLKAAWTGVSSNTRRMKNIPVPRRRLGDDEEAEVDHIVRVRDVKESEVPPFECKNLDAMARVKLRTKNIDTRRFGAGSSHRRASKIIYGARSRATVYGA